MTTIIISDDLMAEAKSYGWNENRLVEEFNDFVRSKLSSLSFAQKIDSQAEIAKTIQTETLTIEEVAGCLKDKTKVTSTVEEMNESIAKMFANWEG